MLLAAGPVSGAQVLINEIMYHAAPEMPEDTGQEWVELFNREPNALNLNGWRLTGGIEFTFTNVTIPAQGYWVVAANVTAFNSRYPAVTNVAGNWTGTLADHGNRIELDDAAGQQVDVVAYASQGDWALRVRGPYDLGHYGWQWFTEADGLGKSLELINPDLPNDNGQNWAPSGPTYGTPGAANSVLNTNIAPLILEGTHFPVIPRSTDPVTITARVLDEQTNGITVTLYYRDASTVSPPPFSSAPMFDDGGHGDGIADDRVYGAVLPTNANGSVIEYYIQASDDDSRTRTWPAAARQLDGITFAQTANALFQIDDSVYTGSQPIYRVIMTEIERQELDAIGRNVGGAADSVAEMNGAFVSSGPAGTELRYLMGFRNRGHGTRTARPNNIRVNFPNDHPWHGVRAIVLNTQYTHVQMAGSTLFQRAGMPVAYSERVQVRVNGANLANAGSPQYGSYVHNEELSSEFVRNHWPTDPGGNSYRGIRIDSPSVHADFTYLGPDKGSCLFYPNCYTNLYFKQSNQADDDWADLIELCSVLSNTLDDEYVDAVNRVVNVDNWLLYFAVNTLADNRETSLSNGNGDDYAMYRGLSDRRFQLQNYDSDTLFGQGDNPGQITASLFRMTNIVSGTTPDEITRFITHPEFVPRYYGTLKRLIDTSFSVGQANATFVRALGDWVPAQTISNMVGWVAQRNAYVLSQIPLNLTASTGLPVVNGYPQTTLPFAALNGRGNAIDTRSVRVNGSAAAWSALFGTWTATVTGLQPGLNRVLVQAFGTNGLEFARTAIDIWYDTGTSTSLGGSVPIDTTWTAADGPYVVASPITVPTGVTLTIEAGTTVFFSAGTGMTVNGRLLAAGNESNHVHFSGVPGGGNWGSLDFLGASLTSRLAYVDFDSCGGTTLGGHQAQLHVNNSTVVLDHCTWPPTPVVEYISFDASSFIVQNCVFPTYPPPSGPESVHGVNGIPAGGYGIFRDNYFGHTWGFSDTIDFTGGNRPGAILQIIGNVFDGASDDHLDLDSTDAWIEGNIFLHAHRDPNRTDDARDTAAAISGGVDFAGEFSEWTVINNLFYDVDHAILNKGGGSPGAGRFVFVNNTLVHVAKESGAGLTNDIAAFDFADDGVPLPDPSYGAGAYVAGNIIWDCPQLVSNYNPSNHTVIFENNILPLAWSGPGSNNVVIDPHLNLSLITNVATADWKTVKAAFTPRPGSPALGTGIGGFDKGGLNPPGLLVFGEGVGTTASTSATLSVAPGGTINWGTEASPYEWGYTHYRWRLDGGPWSAETSVTTSPTITLTNLAQGPHTVFVVGRNDAGYYQDDPLVYPTNAGIAAHLTASRTWTVDTNSARLILNEVLARNDSAFVHGESYPDLIELYNAGGTLFDLTGMGITDDPTDRFKFTFPNGTSLAPGQYLVLFADNPDGTPGIHLGFALNSEGDGVFLFDAAGSVIDSVVFGVQLPDRSIGRMPDGSWELTNPTFGGPNVRQPVGDPRRLKINEWLTVSQNGAAPDFVELYNPDGLPVNLGGLFLSDAPQGSPDRSPIPPLSYVAGNGFLVLLADGLPENGANHLAFRLSSDLGQIALFAEDLSLIDCIFYGPQSPDVSEGRTPSGANSFARFPQPTPGAANPGSGGNCTVTTTTLNLLPMSSTWTYNRDGIDLGTAWRAPGYDDSGWLSGQALLGVEDCGCLPFALNTPLPGYSTTQIPYYFRTTFQVSTNLSGLNLTLSYVLDDGAVIFLDGVELTRIRMPAGTLTATTLPTAVVNNAALDTLTIAGVSLALGPHTLAVEVHNNANPTSSDIVWGMALDGTRSETNCPPTHVVLNEVMAHSLNVTLGDGSLADWVELHNPSADPADLSDFSLSDDPANPRRWAFPSGVTLPPGEYLVVRFNSTNAPSTNNGPILNTGFGLKAEGDRVYLFDAPGRGGALLDSVSFGLQAADYSIGRIPNWSGPWALNLPTPGGPNLAASLGNAALLRVNEWMANPNGGPDWFEIHNPNPQPVTLGGLYLTDDFTQRTQYKIPALSFIGVADGGFAEFFADNNPGQGPNHANFRLAGGGESIGLFGGTGALIDGVTFGLQEEGVSEGRFPDGSTNVARFPGTATPGASNLLPLNDVVVNEVLTHTDLPFEDAIELQNLTTGSIDLSGWYLTDNRNDPRRYRIPDGTILPAGGFAVFYEYQFNPGFLGLPPAFALSAAHGDGVYLFPADAAGNLLGYRAGQQFGAAENAVSMGRYLTSVGVDFVALSNRTFGVDTPGTVQGFRQGTGLTNSGPKVGPVVINEIMYHPPDLGTNDDVMDEFIELKNISATAVSLFNPNFPTNTWRLRDAVDFDFPADTTLAAGDYLLVVSFNPTNTPALTAFRGRYGLSSGVRILGPYQGKLANDADNIELYRPDDPLPDGQADAGFVPFVLVDKVRYADSAPWPSAADGATNGVGVSLQRRAAAAYGNDPANWLAGVPTPAAGNGPAIIVPPTLVALTPSHTVSPGTDDTLNASVTGDGPLNYQWRFQGAPIPGATNASLTLSNIQAVHQGIYTLLVNNPGGAAAGTVFLDVALPPVITQQPQSLFAAVGQSARFRVTVQGSTPLSYQWQKDGTSLPAATNATFVLSNVQPGDAGGYTVNVTNRYGWATSTVATLTLNAVPVIITPPQSASVFVGANVTLSVTANGSPPLRYQWRFNTNNLPGATNSTLVLTNLQVTQSGSYDVRVTNSVGAVLSAAATLTVTVPPFVTVTATDSTASEPGPNTGLFTISRTGSTSRSLTVQFVVSGSATPGNDYVALSGPVTIAASATSTNLLVQPLDDSARESAETVVLTLAASPDYVVGASASATVAILDDDNLPPSVTLTNPVDGAVFTLPTNILLRATAADADGQVAKVEFYNLSTNKLGEATGAPYLLNWGSAPIGSNVVTAVAIDDLGLATVSAPVHLTVNPPRASGFADNFANRGLLTGYTNFVFTNNSTFTKEPGEPSHAGGTGTNTAWISWLAPASGTCVVSTLTNGLTGVSNVFDTVLAVYTGTVVSNLTPIVSNDDSGSNVQSRTNFNAVAGAVYSVAVGGFNATAKGNIYFRLYMPSVPPVFTAQPQGTVVDPGGDVVFSAPALGTPPLAYQWRLNDTNITGATTATLVRNNVQYTDAGSYTIRVTNAAGTALSQAAELLVRPRFVRWQALTNGGLQLTYEAMPGRGHALDSGNDLANWITLATVTNVAVQGQVLDTNGIPAGTSRGYRLRVLP